jgi:hypothetical protein
MAGILNGMFLKQYPLRFRFPCGIFGYFFYESFVFFSSVMDFDQPVYIVSGRLLPPSAKPAGNGFLLL